MSRYSNTQTSSTSSNNSSDYDDITLKLQQYAAVRVTPTQLNASTHDQYGTSFICNFEDAEVLDGVIFQREDKPQTWKVFSAGKFFNLNPQDGLVYETQQDGTYSGEMSADDILNHPRVAGFQETFGKNSYFYKPVGAVIEAADDIAINGDVSVTATDTPSIEVGEASMLLSNSSWTRTLAKKFTQSGNEIINDDGSGPNGNNPKYDTHRWLTTDNPQLRDDLEGRAVELWVTEETQQWDDGTESTYTTPNVLDVKTGELVTIDNSAGGTDDTDDTGGDSGSNAAGQTEPAAPSADGGQELVEPEMPTDDSQLPENVPGELEDLVDYFASNGGTDVSEIRSFAEGNLDNPESVDWEAAVAAVEARS